MTGEGDGMSKYLDETGLAHLWDKLKMLFAGKADKDKGVYRVVGTQTAVTAAWTGNIDVDELYDGLTIAYYLPRNSANSATLSLTLKDGTTTGPVPVYFGTTQVTTHYAAGSTIMLTYWGPGSISINGTATTSARWTTSECDSNTIGEYGGGCIAGANGMARYSLIAQVSENRWESLVLTSGTETSKSKNANGFLITSPILYQSAGTYAENAACGYSGVWTSACNVDTRYSFNCTKSWSAAGRPLYLVGSVSSSNGKFYLKDGKWWADSLPASDDGYCYWYVGQMQDAYQATLHPTHQLFQWLGGRWQTVEAYMRGLIANGFTWGDLAGTDMQNT